MSDRPKDQIPPTKTAAAGGPPKPPKKTARGLADDLPDTPELEIPDPITVKELAARLAQRPFIIVGDLIKAGHVCFPNDPLEFELASKIVRHYGFHPRKASAG